MMIKNLSKAVLELYERTATDLPKDVERRIKDAMAKEKNKDARDILGILIQNVSLARKEKTPICQDTGTPIFYVYYPSKYSQREIKNEILKATKTATAKFLRKNAIDALTGKTIGNLPLMHFEEWGKKYLKISLMLKGGGSENIGMVYKLPNNELNADRDLKGVEKCAIDAVYRAQGFGCPPYILGIGIGGSIESSYEEGKKQLFRKIDDVNRENELKKLENGLLLKLNKLGIGPSGLGGKTTALAVKISALPRHPASFFVAVVFSCWALRRHSLEYRSGNFKIA